MKMKKTKKTGDTHIHTHTQTHGESRTGVYSRHSADIHSVNVRLCQLNKRRPVQHHPVHGLNGRLTQHLMRYKYVCVRGNVVIAVMQILVSVINYDYSCFFEYGLGPFSTLPSTAFTCASRNTWK
jgi:hypothetical protein